MNLVRQCEQKDEKIRHLERKLSEQPKQQSADIEQMLKDEMEGLRIENRQLKDRVIQLTNDLDRA